MKALFNAVSVPAIVAALFVISGPLQAEQAKNISGYKVHYNAFKSTFLSPEVARRYKIDRSSYEGVVNISVQNAEGNSVPAQVQGRARNLVGQIQELAFRRVDDGPVTYYLADFGFSNEETLRFNLSVEPKGGSAGTIEFKQTFYVDAED